MEMVVEKTSLDAIWVSDRLAAVRHHFWSSIWLAEVKI